MFRICPPKETTKGNQLDAAARGGGPGHKTYRRQFSMKIVDQKSAKLGEVLRLLVWRWSERCPEVLRRQCK